MCVSVSRRSHGTVLLGKPVCLKILLGTLLPSAMLRAESMKAFTASAEACIPVPWLGWGCPAGCKQLLWTRLERMEDPRG